MADKLGRGFAGYLAEEAFGRAVACEAGVLSFARVFVLGGRVVIGSAVVAYLGVGGTLASSDVVSEAVASRALDEGSRFDGGLFGDGFVVHEGRFCEKLTKGRSRCVVDEDVYDSRRGIRIGGF